MPFSDPDLIYDDMGTAEEVLAGIAERRPGWEAAEGHSETVLAEVFAIAVSTAMLELRDRLREVYANGFGRNVLELERGTPVSAATTATWTFTNTDPVTVPGGTEVQALGAADEAVVLVVPADIEKAAGLTSLSTTLIALEPGTASNGAAGAGDTDFVGPPNNPVVSVDLDAPASGGEDEETLEDWLVRIRDVARRLHSVPVTPADHAAKAVEVDGVDRAYVRNRYDPTGPDDDAPFHVTVWALDAAGAPVDAPTKTALLAMFNGYDRPHGVTYHAEDADTLDLDVAITVTAKPSADPTALEDAIRANVLAATARATWDRDATIPGGFTEDRTTVLRDYRLAAAIDDLDGLQSVDAITINGGDSVNLPEPLTMPVLVDADLAVTVN
jgi:hypothetical protein